MPSRILLPANDAQRTEENDKGGKRGQKEQDAGSDDPDQLVAGIHCWTAEQSQLSWALACQFIRGRMQWPREAMLINGPRPCMQDRHRSVLVVVPCKSVDAEKRRRVEGLTAIARLKSRLESKSQAVNQPWREFPCRAPHSSTTALGQFNA